MTATFTPSKTAFDATEAQADDEIAAAFRDQKTLDRVLGALGIADTNQDPVELIVNMVSHIEELRSTKATSCNNS